MTRSGLFLLSSPLATALFLLIVWPGTCKSDEAQTSECEKNPSVATCEGFQPSEDIVAKSLASVCQENPESTACSIFSACQKSRLAEKSVFCRNFSLLNSFCLTEGKAASQCQLSTSLCSSSSLVAACDVESPLPQLLPTQKVKHWVSSWCLTNPQASGCKQCVESSFVSKKCDHLATFALICRSSAKSLAHCASLDMMCNYLGGIDSICKRDSMAEDGYEMKEYFHFGVYEYIFFESWKTTQGWHMFFACVLISLLAICSKLIGIYRTKVERRWMGQRDYEKLRDMVKEEDGVLPAEKRSILLNILRSALVVLELLISYLLMLMVMSQNLGILISILLGVFTSCIFIGHIWPHYSMMSH